MGMRPRLPSFLLTTDAQRKPDPLDQALQLGRGQGVILRHYGHAQRESLAHTLSKLARQRQTVLVIAADWRLAAKVGADGVHLPQGLLESGHLAPILGWARRHQKLITAACHTQCAIGRAWQLGLSAGLVSPILPTASHPDARPLGILRFAALCRSTPLPLYALGGIRTDLRRRTGAKGMAGTIPLKSIRQAVTNRI